MHCILLFNFCIIFVLLLFVLDVGHCMRYIGVPVVRVIIIIGGISGDLASTFDIQCGWLCAVL